MARQIGWLEGLARQATVRAGSSWAFGLALAVVFVWLITGPFFGFSDTWQLVINTGTTIMTFLMVFLIQRAQNKDSLAIQLKLNEIVAALEGASNHLINVEDLGEEEVGVLHHTIKSSLTWSNATTRSRNPIRLKKPSAGTNGILKNACTQVSDYTKPFLG